MLDIFLHRVLAEEELQTNIAEKDVFTLPSGQEIEKEYILFYDNSVFNRHRLKTLIRYFKTFHQLFMFGGNLLVKNSAPFLKQCL